MEETCHHRIVRAAFSAVLARNSQRDSVLRPQTVATYDGMLLSLFVICDRQHIQKQTKEALQYELCRVQGDT